MNENKKQHSYLGITVDQSMSFIPHINNVTCKATKVLNFIKLYKCSQHTKSNAYLSLVRPSLQYASSIWDPYYKTHNLTIEKVQRRAARWTLVHDNYDYSIVCLPCCRTLTGLLCNISRRQRARLSLFYKSLHSLITLEIPPYYIPNNYLS